MIKTSSNKLYILILLFLILIFFIFNYRNNLKLDTKYSYQENYSVISPSLYNEVITYSYSFDDYKVIYTKLDHYNFEAIYNYSNQYTSQDILDIKKCKILFNGGFYTKNSKPLGLYYYNREEIGNLINSSIFNGIITLDKDDNWNIIPLSELIFDRSNRFLIQSGPILVSKSVLVEGLSQISSGRRIIFCLDKNGKPSVLVVFNKDFLNDGPNFPKLLTIIKFLIKDKGIDIYKAINLDGGRSSLYIDSNISLKENSFAGSYFCYY